MNKIIYLNDYRSTDKDMQCSDMLIAIAEQKPKNAFVIAWPENGGMPTYHSSTGDMPIVLLRLNQFIHKYYSGDFDN